MNGTPYIWGASLYKNGKSGYFGLEPLGRFDSQGVDLGILCADAYLSFHYVIRA